MTRSDTTPLATILLALRQIVRRMDIQSPFDRMEARP